MGNNIKDKISKVNSLIESLRNYKIISFIGNYLTEIITSEYDIEYDEDNKNLNFIGPVNIQIPILNIKDTSTKENEIIIELE